MPVTFARTVAPWIAWWKTAPKRALRKELS